MLLLFIKMVNVIGPFEETGTANATLKNKYPNHPDKRHSLLFKL